MIKEKIAGIVTSLFGVWKKPIKAGPVTETGMVFVSVNKARNRTVIGCSVRSLVEFVQGEVQKAGGTITQLPDGALHAELPGLALASLQRWPERAREYVTFGVSSGTFGHQPREQVVPTRIVRSAISESPWSVEKGTPVLVQFLTDEIPIGRPHGLAEGQELSPTPTGPSSVAPSPFSGDSGIEDPDATPPLPTEVGQKQIARSPWGVERGD